ncbi:PAS domain-containing hybrid sensor histidine kinase/response regulator [Neptunomonas antarctica]|uniref:histidine kinase n=1 Tax=Neptunomonas antarctica TaxID=619304 RepID=A0A1N7IVI7_9GAMM|nr:PAS domain-containing hybrid sensor histidine kinase/response regulator [Neptunomonas antarctica]SIS41103.1 PAS domain S-box-containing protein [Neptunomonas antarctica]
MTETAQAVRLAQLEKENYKLKRINQALIERVESGNAQNANPYATFEHSVALAEQVRERTEALNDALSELKISHQALKNANQIADLANQRLVDAIESISDAFVLFDRERRIVLCNSKFESVWKETGQKIATGTTIQDIRRLAVEHGLIAEEYGEAGDGHRVFRLAAGQWIQMSERPTADGGMVVLYTDISQLKAAETERREVELAQKSRLLQRMVDNLSQGIALVNASDQLEIWNDRFLSLTGVSREQAECLPPFRALNLRHFHDSRAKGGQSDTSNVMRHNDHIIEVRTHAMPDGGYVNTYTDITERYQYAETLKESEQWIRLITDHVPALIAYVGDDLCYRFTNKVYDEWYGWERGKLTGESIKQVHGAHNFRELQPYIQRVLSGENVSFDIAERNSADEQRHMLKSYVPNLGADGKTVGFFVMIRDITDRRKVALELEEAYQSLEQRVGERTSELTAVNEHLLSEIEERTHVEARLREAKKDAEQANLSKTKFLAAVSHDLLQPLNAARLFTGALAEKPLSSDTRPLVNSVTHALGDVESLLGTLVDISKLDAGVVTPDITTFRASELMENIANEFSQFAQHDGLIMRYIPSSVVISSDSQLLARILRNFLSNAIRYTAKGQILFGCRRKSQTLSIEVWDTGLGIPEAQLQEIFQEFRRLNPQDQGRDKGLGLGLAIVDKISSVLRHPINVRSIEGKGSVFSVEVPYGELALYSAVPEYRQQTISDCLRGAHIWVIDNDQAICEGMQTLLEGWGCYVTTALSLEQLLERVNPARDPVDLLVADYHLDDGKNGVDAARCVAEQRDQLLRVLMITANYNKDLKQEIRELGYILMNKPVKPLKLKTTLLHLLKER